MTRINLVDVKILADQHLIAEYREITRVFSLVEKSLVGKSIQDIIRKVPNDFCLNKGHVLFFYNKLKWVEDRYLALYEECNARKFNVKSPHDLIIKYRTILPNELYNDFKPSDIDLGISMDRLILRLSEKPEFYRFFGNKIYVDYKFISEKS